MLEKFHSISTPNERKRWKKGNNKKHMVLLSEMLKNRKSFSEKFEGWNFCRFFSRKSKSIVFEAFFFVLMNIRFRKKIIKRHVIEIAYRQKSPPLAHITRQWRIKQFSLLHVLPTHAKMEKKKFVICNPSTCPGENWTSIRRVQYTASHGQRLTISHITLALSINARCVFFSRKYPKCTHSMACMRVGGKKLMMDKVHQFPRGLWKRKSPWAF